VSIWEKYPQYDDSELKQLVWAAAQTLAETGHGSRVPDDALEMSDKAAAEEIQRDLADVAPASRSEHVRKLLTDPGSSRQISLAILDELRQVPELAAAVDEAYERQTRMLGGPELLLLAAPLLLLMLRIESVSWKSEQGPRGAKKSLDIKLGKATAAAKALVAGLVTGFTSGANAS
jgi:hypothetical protein